MARKTLAVHVLRNVFRGLYLSSNFILSSLEYIFISQQSPVRHAFNSMHKMKYGLR